MEYKKIPADIRFVLILVITETLLILIPPLSDSFLRTILGLPMLLFLPGYALIAALFPGKDDLDGIERVALSFGLSIAVVPLIGLGLNYTPWGIRLIPILFSISLFIIVMCAVAVVRRKPLPPENTFEVPFREGYETLREELTARPENRIDRILTIVLVISILVSVITLIYVIVVPKQGEQFTEFYILGPEGMADNYPVNYTLGESKPVIVGIVNHEYEAVNYSLELRLENNTLPQVEDYGTIILLHNQTWENTVHIQPDRTGEDMKLQFLLYREDNMSDSYRELHLWIDVEKE
jgi:uncharacterized membrane protein